MPKTDSRRRLTAMRKRFLEGVGSSPSTKSGVDSGYGPTLCNSSNVHPSTSTSRKYKFLMRLVRSVVLCMDSHLHLGKESDRTTGCMVSHIRCLLPVLDENTHDGSCDQTTAPSSTQRHVK
ncbi:hypothetical protein VNO77_03293 [Canavalia gladiata]|uniref:Uncharacterized protein n=1 Tax=Canavalia gladiata TaxID=3824 RepID=A0AAN9MUH4_CANGL